MKTHSEDRIKSSKHSSSTLRFIFLCLMAAGFETGLLAMGIVREQPLFWHDAGGFPVWMRGFVLFSFYPLLALAVLWLAWISISPARVRFFGQDRRWTMACLTGLWLLQGMVFIVIVANNIDNLRHHHPVHWHPAPLRHSP